MGAIGGMAVGLLVASKNEQQTSFATLETRVVPELDGHVRVYVPLVDWRVELLDHAAPASIDIEVRGSERTTMPVSVQATGRAATR